MMLTGNKLVVWLLLFWIGATLALAQDAAPQQNLPRNAPAAAEPLLPPQDKTAIIHLDAEVDDMMLRSLKRRVQIASRTGCTVLIFEMDTWGGSVTSAIEISKYIKELAEQKKFITVAWVHNKAISAGAMITSSCQHVVMSSLSSYGDCAPIAVARSWTGDQLIALPPAERAKMQGPVVSEFLDSAQRNHWSPSLLTAMVVVEEEVHEMHKKGTTEYAYVNSPEKDALLAVQEVAPDGTKVHPWEYVRTIDDDKQLLTVSADQALKMKLSEGTVDTEEQLCGLLNIRGTPARLEFSWAENATVFLTDIIIRFILFVGMLVFAWLEFSHPGTFVFGTAALLCLALLIGAPFLTGLAQIWEIALIVIGVAIVIADLIAFGGIGMLAIPGFVLMAIGLVASFIPSDPAGGIMHSQQAWGAAERGLGVIVGGTFLSVGLFYFMAKYLHVVPGFRRLQLAPAGGMGAGATAIVRDAADRDAADAVFVGALGRVASDLRPAGKARFGEHLVDVVSYGSFIEAGTDVVVIELKGTRVVVKPYAGMPGDAA